MEYPEASRTIAVNLGRHVWDVFGRLKREQFETSFLRWVQAVMGGSVKMGRKAKRHLAGWNNDYLLTVLASA